MARRRFYKSELTVSCESNARNKNLMGVLISILVLIAISSLIVMAIVVINPEIVSQSARSFQVREPITLEEAMLNELSPNRPAFQWLSSGAGGGQDELLFEDSKNIQIMSLPVASDDATTTTTAAASPAAPMGRFANGFAPNVTTLVSNTSLLSSIDYQGFKISPSKRYLLIWTARKKHFRHSFTAKYFIYDIKLDLISLLSTRSPSSTTINSSTSTANQFEHLDSATEYLNSRSDGDKASRFQCVDWFEAKRDIEGDSTKDSLILIQDNDIYLLANIGSSSSSNGAGDSQASQPVRLTFTGQQEGIFNGIPDWLYEEEILSDTPAFQVSPAASSLAYMSFNDSRVDLMPYSIYGPSEQVYPRIQQIRYPKAGRANPRVTIHVIDRLTEAPAAAPRSQVLDVQLELPDDLATRQHYINRISWLGDDRLALIWLNRNQNESYIVLCSRQFAWKCEKNLHLEAAGGWLELSDTELLLLPDERHYLTVLLKPESGDGADLGNDKFRHLAKVSLEQPNSYSFITSGRREVTTINGFDKERGLVFYGSTLVDEPGQRQVFAVDLNADGRDTCLTCDLLHSSSSSSSSSGECLFNSATMSNSGKYFVFDCEGPAVPRTELRSVGPILRKAGAGASVVRSKLKTARAVAELPVADLPAIQKLTPAGSSSSSSDKAVEQRQAAQTNRSAAVEDASLLWLIEENQELRDRLQRVKAMPLTMRLKVPIANTNYSANVLLLLPPQLGGGSSSVGRSVISGPRQRGLPRSRRAAAGAADLDQAALGAYFTRDTIGAYTDQLSSEQQFPMVVDVYAGPGSQKVDYRFHVGFGHYLASSRRTIYAMIDGRGSGYQGTKRLYELYHRFGTVEIQDQIEVSAWLARAYPTLIDAGRVAIWGWSYGGYAAAMALAQSNARALRDYHAKLRQLTSANKKNGSTIAIHQLEPPSAPPRLSPTMMSGGGVFECAASVAPVTNWIYYDTAYTERYMSSPYLNNHYDESSPGDHNKQQQQQQNQSPPQIEQETNRWIPLNNITAGSLAQQSPLAGLINQSAATQAAANGGKSPVVDLNEHYARASLIDQIANIDRRRYLLIHGTADDNVHFQQSIFLMKRLIQKNVMFESRLYPDQDHGIANRADKLHLGATLSSFFAECFDMAY